jgi:hypothetical protein
VGDRVGDGDRLEQQPQLRQLGRVLQRQRGDAGATLGDELHEALAGEPVQRLTQRRRADREALRELRGQQPLAGLQITVEDRPPQLLLDPFDPTDRTVGHRVSSSDAVVRRVNP